MQYIKLRRTWNFILSGSVVSAFCLSAFGFQLVYSRTQSTASAPPEDAALRAAVEEYFAAYGKKDLTGVITLWSERSPHLAAYKQSLQQQFTTEGLSFGSPVISRVKVESEKASLRVTIALTSINLKSQQKSERRMIRIFEFIKEGGAWGVWRYAPAAEDLAEALVKAGNKAEREALLEEESELVTVELVQQLLAQGQQLLRQGSYDRAKEICELALEVAERCGDKSTIIGALLSTGNVHRLQNNYTQALEQYQKSLKVSEEIGDKDGIASALRGIGNVQILQGNNTQALELYRKSLKVSEEIGDKDGIARTLSNIGVVHQSQGNNTQALEMHQKSLKVSEEIGNKTGIARTLINIGAIYQSQGNNTQALEMHQKSLKILGEIGNKAGIAMARTNIGVVHQSQGDYAQALELYQKSLKIYEEIGEEEGIALTLMNIGTVHWWQGNYAQALELYQKSLKIYEEIGDKHGIASSLMNIGDWHESQGNHTQALQFAERAADLALQTGRHDDLRQAHTIAGRAYFALGQLGRARQSFDAAIATIEALRAQVAGGEQEQQRFFESRISPYQVMVELLITQNNPGEALIYAERAKARVLLDLLSIGRVSVTKTMTGPEIEQERRLNSQLVSLNSQSYREKQRPQPDRDQLKQLDSQLEKARLDLEAFQTDLFAAHPELKVRRGEAPPLRLEQMDALLPDAATALLEFAVVEDKTYLFVITKSVTAGVKVYPLEIKQTDLKDRIERFRQMLSTSDNRFSKPAHELYDLLLKPAATQLQGKTRLVIVPDGPLWELPFQALQTPQDRYLIDDHTIFYVPSLTVLREMINARHNKEAKSFTAPTLLAMGNPVLDPQTTTRVKAALMDGKLDPLPEAEQQVRTLGRIYGHNRSKVYIGPEAREERFKTEAKDFRILHLATHGILNDRSPMYSHLLLAQSGEATDEDGMLEARELMKLDLKADLAVLSACETARGRIGKGEGMIGMTWALFVAGVPTTVASQWKVRSDSTAELMVEFHRRLKTRRTGYPRRNSAAEALRAAALKLKGDSRYQHPFHWAGFIVVGDGY